MNTNYPLGSNNPKAPWNREEPPESSFVLHEGSIDEGLRFEYSDVNNCEPVIMNVELWNEATESWVKLNDLPMFLSTFVYERCLKIAIKL